jgi:hypothetical protein
LTLKARSCVPEKLKFAQLSNKVPASFFKVGFLSSLQKPPAGSYPEPFYAPLSHFFNVKFNIIFPLCLDLNSVYFSSGFPAKVYTYICLIYPRVLHSLFIAPSLILQS